MTTGDNSFDTSHFLKPDRIVNLLHPLLLLYSSLCEDRDGMGRLGGRVHNKCSLSVRLPIRPLARTPARLDLSIWTIFGQEKGRKEGKSCVRRILFSSIRKPWIPQI